MKEIGEWYEKWYKRFQNMDESHEEILNRMDRLFIDAEYLNETFDEEGRKYFPDSFIQESNLLKEESQKVASKPQEVISTQSLFEFEEFTYVAEKYTLKFKEGADMQLTVMEGKLFLPLVQNIGEVTPNKLLIQSCWDESDTNDYFLRKLRVGVRLFRTRLEKEKKDAYLKISTIRGIGYQLNGENNLEKYSRRTNRK